MLGQNYDILLLIILTYFVGYHFKVHNYSHISILTGEELAVVSKSEGSSEGLTDWQHWVPHDFSELFEILVLIVEVVLHFELIETVEAVGEKIDEFNHGRTPRRRFLSYTPL